MTRTLAALALLGLATHAAAQQGTYGRVEVREPAWLGISYDIRWIQQTGTCQPQVLVEAVVPGSPAERAGLRNGDAIIALDGSGNPATRLPLIATRLVPGDSVHLRVTRGGSVREMVAVADRRPSRPPAVIVGASGLMKSTAPVVQLRGDTLVARNIESGGLWTDAGGRGYWLQDDGRTEFRRLSSWSGDELDRRVSELMACADTVRWTAEVPTVARVDLSRIQAQADSLRVILARRALDEQSQRAQMLRELTERAQAPQGYELRVEPPSAFVYWYDENVGAGQRAVAGAELSPLEPELAEYFSGVREGLLVLRVADGSPAERAGLRPGDVITAGDGRRVTSVARFRSLLSGAGDDPVRLRVVRHGRDRSLTIRRD